MVVRTTRRNELISRAARPASGWVLGTAGGQRLVVEGLVDLGVRSPAAWRGGLPSLLDEVTPVSS